MEQCPDNEREKMEYVRTELNNTPHATYIRVVYKDSQGKEWMFRGAQFWYDLLPYEHNNKYVNAEYINIEKG